jgi:hypothetical protein
MARGRRHPFLAGFLLGFSGGTVVPPLVMLSSVVLGG